MRHQGGQDKNSLANRSSDWAQDTPGTRERRRWNRRPILEREIESLARTIAHLEDQHQGHVDHGRTHEAVQIESRIQALKARRRSHQLELAALPPTKEAA